jgi:hypothetical protein
MKPLFIGMAAGAALAILRQCGRNPLPLRRHPAQKKHARPASYFGPKPDEPDVTRLCDTPCSRALCAREG